jgi:hypothetical protein
MCEAYLRDSRFVTVWAAVLNPVSRRLTYASAGHNPPRLLRGGNVLSLDVVGGLPLGFDPAATYDDAGITLEPEDLLVIYTNGITEAMRDGIDENDPFVHNPCTVARLLSNVGERPTRLMKFNRMSYAIRPTRPGQCAEIHRQRRQRLARAVMQFARDPTPFPILGLQKAGR